MKRSKPSLRQIKEDFNFLKPKIESGEILAIVLYGSYVKNEQNARSDIDICIIAPKYKALQDISKLLRYIWGNIDANKYDVRTFEELPLYIKASVIKNHILLMSRDESGLKYYFYKVNKLWLDQSIHWIDK